MLPLITINRLNGKEVIVTWNDRADQYTHERELTKGSVITVKYFGENNYGTLLQPKFYRIRSEVSWSQLKSQYENDQGTVSGEHAGNKNIL